jgi:hypothetical protein
VSAPRQSRAENVQTRRGLDSVIWASGLCTGIALRGLQHRLNFPEGLQGALELVNAILREAQAIIGGEREMPLKINICTKTDEEDTLACPRYPVVSRVQ